MQRIKLTRNKYAIIDDEDFGYLNQYKWFAKPGYKKTTYYAARSPYLGGGRKNPIRITIFMHNEVLQPSSGEEIDHINRNGLDNRRTNLRSVNRSRNILNGKLRKDNTSGTKGVAWHKRDKKWQVRLSIDGKRYNLGYFFDKYEAEKVYQNFLKERWVECQS